MVQVLRFHFFVAVKTSAQQALAGHASPSHVICPRDSAAKLTMEARAIHMYGEMDGEINRNSEIHIEIDI